MKLDVDLRRVAFEGSSPARMTPRAITPLRKGVMVSIAVGDPATAMRIWAARAAGGGPKTGAAMSVQPCVSSWVAREAVVFGWTVVVSIRILPPRELVDMN